MGIIIGYLIYAFFHWLGLHGLLLVIVLALMVVVLERAKAVEVCR